MPATTLRWPDRSNHSNPQWPPRRAQQPSLPRRLPSRRRRLPATQPANHPTCQARPTCQEGARRQGEARQELLGQGCENRQGEGCAKQSPLARWGSTSFAPCSTVSAGRTRSRPTPTVLRKSSSTPAARTCSRGGERFTTRVASSSSGQRRFRCPRSTSVRPTSSSPT